MIPAIAIGRHVQDGLLSSRATSRRTAIDELIQGIRLDGTIEDSVCEAHSQDGLDLSFDYIELLSLSCTLLAARDPDSRNRQVCHLSVYII